MLPPFNNNRGYPSAGSGSRIHHRHQAIIPSYRLNCCGNITKWGVDLNPDRTAAKFKFIFQVWRPASNGCYSLVNDFVSTDVQPESEYVANITPSPADQLQFQHGDVLGFYVESHGEGDHLGSRGDANNGVVLLSSGSYTSESVWYGSIDTTSQSSQSGSCPYPVGTAGVLNSLARAAPVISISITTYSCHQSFSTIVGRVSSSPSSPLDRIYSYNSRPITDDAAGIPSSNNIDIPSKY